MNSTEFSIVGAASYFVACTACTGVSDMAAARWCDCLGKDRSPVCVACGACLCRAKLADRHKFWAGAPNQLNERRRRDARRQPEPATVAPQAPLVMLVDDDEEIRAVGAYIIGRLGFRCTTASDGPEALELLGRERASIVITDALMPKMDGRELCRFIKKSSSAKVVIMTSLYTGTRYRNEAYKRYGADEYLAKPIDFSELQATLTRLMSAVEQCA